MFVFFLTPFDFPQFSHGFPGGEAAGCQNAAQGQHLPQPGREDGRVHHFGHLFFDFCFPASLLLRFSAFPVSLLLCFSDSLIFPPFLFLILQIILKKHHVNKP